MGEISAVPPNRFQQISEKILGWGALILLEVHMLFCPYREVLAKYYLVQVSELWFGLFLLLFALLYLLVSAFAFPQSFCRIRAFFRRLCSFEQLYLVGLLFWYIFTVFLRQVLIGRENGTNYFSDNDWWLFITAMMAFIMFPMARILGSEKMKRVFNPMLKLVLLPHLVYYSWALWQYLHLNEVVFPSGSVLHMDGSSMEIGVNRNSVGAYGVTMLVMCLYLIATEKRWRKIPYFYGVAVYTAVIILSNCRTSWYTALLVTAAAGFLFVWNFLREKHVVLRVGTGLLLAAAGVLLLHWLRGELFALLDASVTAAKEAAPVVTASFPRVSAVPLASSHFKPALPAAVPLAADVDAHLRTYEIGLNGRESIFRAALYLMFNSKYCFFFGVTPTDVGTSLYGICGVQKVFPHAHNFFLQMGVSYGVPCMLVTFVFVISLFIRSLRLLFSKSRQLPSGFWMIPVVAFCMVLQDMMEAFLNSGGTLICVFFYVFAGWMTALDTEQQEVSITKSTDSGK